MKRIITMTENERNIVAEFIEWCQQRSNDDTDTLGMLISEWENEYVYGGEHRTRIGKDFIVVETEEDYKNA